MPKAPTKTRKPAVKAHPMVRVEPLRFLVSVTAPTMSKTALEALIRNQLSGVQARSVSVKQTNDPEKRAFVAEAAVARLTAEQAQTAEAKAQAKEAREAKAYARLCKKYATNP